MSEQSSQWTSSVVLGDGETVSIRPLGPADQPRLLEFHHRQSADSIYRRFFSPKPTLSQGELDQITRFEPDDRAALVVESHGEILGWASYARWTGRADADAAFMVDDRHHGRGIATLMLEHLAAIATAHGIDRFTAEVLAENRPMLTVFAKAGWPIERRFDSGVIEIDFALDETAEFVDSVSRREQRADSSAMARLLLPRSTAVIGATDREGTFGGELWKNVSAGTTLPVYAVNPNRTTLGDQHVWPRITDVPAEVSLAIVVVPAAELETVIDECIEARVRGAVVMTNIDGSGVDMTSIVARARGGGLRIVGPTSMGVASSRPEIGLHATVFRPLTHPGTVALSVQSGSLGTSMVWLAEQVGLGLSWFVSLGDRSDVSGNDLLQFWDDDESTTAIGMYTESLGNPRRFARIARRVSRRRPIVAVRTGTAAIGPSGGALYQHCGLIEVPTVTAMLDTLRVLASQPVMRGPRTAVISNSRSPEVLARAAIAAAALTPVDPPVQLDFRSTSADYGAAVRAALADDDIDGLVVIHAPPLEDAIGEPAAEIDSAATDASKPVVAVVLGARDAPIAPGSSVSGFAFPEPAAAVLGRSYAYGQWLRTEAAATPETPADIDDAAVTALLAGALAAGRTMLDVDETFATLAAYGIAMPASRFVAADDALAAAEEIGFPVAIKAGTRRVGRSLKAGVALDLSDETDVVSSVAIMREELGDGADAVLVQAMTAPGVDVRVRVTVDEQLGPLVSVGVGGVGTNLLADEDSRLAPLSRESATALVTASRAGAALSRADIDVESLVGITVRAGQLAADHPELVDIDLNPVITTAAGCCVTDAVILVAPVGRATTAIRRL